MKERDFIEWIRGQSAMDAAKVPVEPGDDCAVVAFGGELLLVTTDQVLDGVHFILAEHGPRAAGRKAMARNLSDIAAMAGLPTAAVAAVALPRDFRLGQAEAIYAGLREAGDPFDCPVVGGDVAAWDGPLAITVTVMGKPAGQGGPVLRSGAKAGDAVCVTGRLGGAWRGRRHLEFVPRIVEAARLAADYRVTAMIDISDGLATDLHHICRESGVAAEIVAAEIPIHPDALAGSDRSGALAAALGDGEDYELLFTLPPDQAERLCRAQRSPEAMKRSLSPQPIGVEVARIGTITAKPAGPGSLVTLVETDGTRRPIDPSGWEHRTGADQPGAQP